MPGRKEYRGSSGVISLNGTLTAAASSCQCDGNVAGWPMGVTYPSATRIDAGTITEEKILCTSLTAGTPNLIQFAQRGYDGTTASGHSPGAPVQHCADADSFDTFASHAFDTTRDDHPQYIKTDGSRPFTGLGAIAGTPVPIGTTNAAGSAATLARSDHVHDIGDGAIDHATIIGPDVITAAQIAPNAIGASELGDASVHTIAIQLNAVTNARIADNAVTNTKLADAAVNTAELADGAVTPVKLASMPCCRLTRSSNVSIPNATDTAIGMGTEDVDTDNMHDGVNPSRITFKTAGVYIVGGTIQYDVDSSGKHALFIKKNGSIIIALTSGVGAPTIAGQDALTASTMGRFAVNDYIELFARQSTGAALLVMAVVDNSPVLWAGYVSS